MSIFKQQAEIRAASLRLLIYELEQDRDKLLDELANTKGRAEQLEKTIARAYEMIVDINKNEHEKEVRHLAEQLIKQQQEEEQAKKEKEREEFEKAKQGIKTAKVPRRKRE